MAGGAGSRHRSGSEPTLTARFDAFQRRHRSLGLPLGVVYKFFDDQGSYLAALMTYYAFLSVFPLLLLASSILGFLMQGNPQLSDAVLDSALAQFPVLGPQLSTPSGLTGSSVAIVVGLFGALYGALGVAQALQNAMNVAWAVPRNRRPNPLLGRIRSVLLLTVTASVVLVIALFSMLVTELDPLGGDLAGWSRLLVGVATTALDAVVLALVFRLATTEEHGFREVLPGALTAAVVLQGMRTVGAQYIAIVVRNSGPTYGTFAVVLGLLGWIYIFAIIIVLCAELNVVLTRHLYPRALLTPFLDDVDLTAADRRAYSAYAQAQRHKSFQTVEVRFDSERDGHDESDGAASSGP